MRFEFCRKPNFPKRTQITIYRSMSLAPANASIKQATANAQDHTKDIRYPVVYVGAAVEAGLDEFNGAAKGACAYKDGQQANAARAGQREGECGEGYEVDEFVSAIWYWLLTSGPEHCDGQGERRGERQGYVEVLAHPLGCIDPLCQWQVWAFV